MSLVLSAFDKKADRNSNASLPCQNRNQIGRHILKFKNLAVIPLLIFFVMPKPVIAQEFCNAILEIKRCEPGDGRNIVCFFNIKHDADYGEFREVQFSVEITYEFTNYGDSYHESSFPGFFKQKVEGGEWREVIFRTEVPDYGVRSEISVSNVVSTVLNTNVYCFK